MVFGLLHKLPKDKKINLAISVAGFYKDEGWGCEGLFSEPYEWRKVREQARKVYVFWSSDDSYISKGQTDYLAKHTGVKPTIFENKKHFNLEAGLHFKKLPELLEVIKNDCN